MNERPSFISPTIIEAARNLRKTQTNVEQILWYCLRNRNFMNLKFRRQYPLGSFVLDFYCHDILLGIELDGSQHMELDQKLYDQERENFLKEKGIRLIRFWNNEILENLEGVLE